MRRIFSNFLLKKPTDSYWRSDTSLKLEPLLSTSYSRIDIYAEGTYLSADFSMVLQQSALLTLMEALVYLPWPYVHKFVLIVELKLVLKLQVWVLYKRNVCTFHRGKIKYQFDENLITQQNWSCFTSFMATIIVYLFSCLSTHM